ncbi:MAG: hypothetical protein GTO63_02875, partial [Anaerolineae bacterium]|nr:hypothetical protein [Anaerolineae bacterium]NIN93980.1 hypothetical protein [Anaerolineae bacterium]
MDINMTGDVTASEPIVLIQTGDYTSKSPIPVQSVHKVMLSAKYDTADEKEVDTLTFPTGWVL